MTYWTFNPLCSRGDLGRQSVILFLFCLQWSGVDVLDFLVVDVYPHDHVYRRRASLHKCLSQLEQGCGKHWGKRNAHPLPLKKNEMQAIEQWYDSTDAILNLNYTILKVELLIFVLSFSGIWSSFTGQWFWYQERIEFQFGFQFYYQKSFRVSVKCQIYLLYDFSMVIFLFIYRLGYILFVFYPNFTEPVRTIKEFIWLWSYKISLTLIHYWIQLWVPFARKLISSCIQR